MISNLGFNLTGLGGTNPEYFANQAALVTRLNTLTGKTWVYDAATCTFSSVDYVGAPPTITTRYRADFVDANADSVGFCNAGALDYTKFTKIDLSPYGGNASTPITGAGDITAAFAALTPSLNVVIVGCQFEVINWDRATPPTNVEVNSSVKARIEDGTLHELLCADY